MTSENIKQHIDKITRAYVIKDACQANAKGSTVQDVHVRENDVLNPHWWSSKYKTLEYNDN